MTVIIGALSEAWAELRHHKLRVLLSLVGIAVSVGAIAAVVALGEYQRQIAVEQSDTYGGRSATIAVSAYRSDGSPLDIAGFDARVAAASDRFGFTHLTRLVDQVPMTIQTTDFVRPVMTRLVDPAYPVIHRSVVEEGRWFVDGDETLAAPPIVVSEPLWESLGAPALSQHPTVTLTGEAGGTYQVIGVTPKEGPWDQEKKATLLYDSYIDRVEALPADAMVGYEIWVSPDIVAEIGPLLAMDLRAGAPAGEDISVSRSDWASQPGMQDQFVIFELVTGAIAGLVLLLGGLGLVNIQLVAMRQRIREIGVRRSFGATAGRIFTTVLLESVVATAVAGVIGVAIAVAVMRSPWVLEIFPNMQDVPPFPMRAAVTALVAAVVIGALAGFLPALSAVRSRVIDALRF